MKIGTCAAIAITMLLATPTGLASLDVGGPVLVTVRDRHGYSCDPQPVRGCIATVTTNGTLGGSHVDAYQSYSLIGVAFDPPPLPLLGDSASHRAVWMEGDAIYFEYDLMRQASQAYARIPQERPHRDAGGLSFTSENATIYARAPPVYDPAAPAENKSYGVEFGSDGIGGYNQTGPFNAAVFQSTDAQLYGMANLTCLFLGDTPECYRRMNDSRDWWLGMTPSATLGLAWENVTVATNKTYIPNETTNRTNAPRAEDHTMRGATNRHDATYTSRDSTGGPTYTSTLATWTPPSDIPPPRPTPPPAHYSPASTTTQPPPKPDRAAIAAAIGVALGSSALLALAAWGLYSRLNDPRTILDHPQRAAIIRLVREQPGIAPRALQVATGLSKTGLLHHLQLLKKHHIIRQEQVGEHVVLFPTGHRAPPTLLAALERDHPTRGVFVRALEDAPGGLTREELHARASTMPLRTRNHTLRRLIQLGIIRADGERYTLTTTQPDGAAGA